MLTVLNDMNTSAAVSGNTWTKSTTGNMLEMILDNKLYNTYQGSATWGDYNAIYGYDRDGDLEGNGASGDPRKNNIDPGLFCAFSYMAYNYYWTKNPNALVDTENGHTNCNTSWTNGVNGDHCTAWDWEDKHQTALADQLSYGYMHTNSTQTTLSSSSSTQNTTFQEATSNVQTMNNAAQQMIQSFSQGQGQTITNFKG